MAILLTHRILFTLALCLSALCLLQAEHGGFSVDIIHRDSPNSPFFNPSESHTQRLNNALQRSNNRVNQFKATSVSSNTPQSTIVSSNAEYLMAISIGTPPVKILAIADTGSSLIWTQCKPCAQCFKQKDPLFDPRASSTYKKVSCNSKQCQYVGLCPSDIEESCSYTVSYGDGSYTYGTIAKERVSLGSTNGRVVSFPNTIFGCGYNNSGIFDEHGSGIIGLGQGPASLISQLSSVIGGRFSYCLVPFSSNTENTSTMHFGKKSVVSGPGVLSTPLVLKEPDYFYFLKLEAISVGNDRLQYSKSNSSSNASIEGNIIIDSGTTLTMLPKDFYLQLESAVSKAIDGERARDKLSPLCYKTKSDHFGAPNITLHFRGADLKLHSMNSFVRVAKDVVCFTFAPLSGLPFGILGNLVQTNFLVGYDLQRKTLSFKQTDCTKQ